MVREGHVSVFRERPPEPALGLAIVWLLTTMPKPGAAPPKPLCCDALGVLLVKLADLYTAKALHGASGDSMVESCPIFSSSDRGRQKAC